MYIQANIYHCMFMHKMGILQNFGVLPYKKISLLESSIHKLSSLHNFFLSHFFLFLFSDSGVTKQNEEE